MADSYSSKVLSNSTPEQMSKLMRLDESTPEKWQRDDLVSMARHQLLAPLEFDLLSLGLNAAEQKSVTHSGNRGAHSHLKTFRDLFQSSDPPCALLKLSHRFFKQRVTNHHKDSSEHKIAYLFYLLSIVAARVRTGERISKLTDKQLLDSIQLEASLPWVDPQIKELLVEGRNKIALRSKR